MQKISQKYTLNIPDTPKPRIVVVGGGFGGINLLKGLSGDHYQVVLLDRYNYHTFQPLLYQVATAGLEPDSVAGPLRKIISHKDDFYFRMVKVDGVDAEQKIVFTPAGTLEYDYLVIATGAKINFFNNNNISVHAFPLKQVTHALDLRSHIFQQFEKYEILSSREEKDEYLSFVVVGAGPTGVEVCGALAELREHVLPKDYPDLDMQKVNIWLIEGLDRVLPAMSEESGKKAHRYLNKMGVKLQLNCLTEDYDGKVVKLNNGQRIRTQTLIWAAGVMGNVILVFPEGSTQKGKLRVNPYNQVYADPQQKTVYDTIFAIGDVAMMKTEDYPDGHPGLAQVAIQQGKHLAFNMKQLAIKKTLRPFRYKHKGVMATIGKNKAVADFPGKLRLSGFTGWVAWMTVHLLFMVGFRNKAVALANWIWNYFTWDRGIRLILRPSTKQEDRISRHMKQEMKESKILEEQHHE